MAKTKLTSKRWNGFRVEHVLSGSSLRPRPAVKKKHNRRRKKRASLFSPKKKKIVKKYVVDRIVRRIEEVGGQVYYEVKWKNYSEFENSLEPRDSLMKDIPLLIQHFEAQNVTRIVL